LASLRAKLEAEYEAIVGMAIIPPAEEMLII